jgi:hypothetical protein
VYRQVHKRSLVGKLDVAGTVRHILKHPVSDPQTGLDRPVELQDVEATRFQDDRHMKVIRFSDQRTGRLYPLGDIPGAHLC